MTWPVLSALNKDSPTPTELVELQESVCKLLRNLAIGIKTEPALDALRCRCATSLIRAQDTNRQMTINGLIQLLDSAYCPLQYDRQLNMYGRARHQQAA